MYPVKGRFPATPVVVALLLCALIGYLNAGCSARLGQDETENITDGVPQLPAAMTPSATEVVATLLPPSTPTKAPKATTVPSPSPTPWPTIRLAVPEHLRTNVEVAIGTLDSTGYTPQWQLVPPDTPADVRLEPGAAGIFAGRRDLALTVSLTEPWERVDLSTANEIVASEHQSVAVMDWAEMPAHRKALRVDGLLPSEEGYPIDRPWSLLAQPGYEESAGRLATALQASLNDDSVLSLAAVGDVMLDRALGYAIQSGDLAFPFSLVSGQLMAADLTVGNLESSLGDVGQPAAKSYTFQAPPAAADSLAMAGFDVLTLANNHAMDYGPEALSQALSLLNERGIATVGAGADEAAARTAAFVERDGLRVAFLAYVDVPVEVTGFDTRAWEATPSSPGLAWANADKISEDVVAAAAAADIIIVLLHSGYEYVLPPSPAQVAAARAAVDAGADLVIGHHAHVLQGVEFRDQSVIVYGLGNFAFEIDGDPSTAILNVWLDSRGVRQLEFLPAIIQFGGRPRPATPGEAAMILQGIYYQTTVLNHSP